jgi:hypothetical protein
MKNIIPILLLLISTSNSYAVQDDGSNNRGAGACCVDNDCVDVMDHTKCDSAGGTWHAGMTCATFSCGPTGACCNAFGLTCSITSQQECNDNGGYFWGENTDCIQADCTDEPWGACCLGEGGCTVVYSEIKCEWGNEFYQYQTCEEADCPEACAPHGIFDNVAYALSIECGGFASPQDPGTGSGSTWPNLPSKNGGGMWENTPYIRLDLDSNGTAETITQMPFHVVNDKWAYNTEGTCIRAGDSFGTVQIFPLLNLDPGVMSYIGTDFPDYTPIYLSDFIDVTGDGLLDAIIVARVWDNDQTNQTEVPFYVINTSTPPVVACETDINHDGMTDVTDMLAIIGAWGSCP